MKNITSANYSISTAGYLISHVHWLNKIRKTTNEPEIIQGINISITILLCTYIESVLNELLDSIIEKRIKETEDLAYKRVLENIQLKLSKASWNQYQELCKTLLPNPLNHYTDNEVWKGIKALFSLRNVLVHGKKIESRLLFYEDKIEIEYSGVYDKILDYFKEQKVLKSHQLKSSKHKILTIQSTTHFIKISDKFVDEFFEKISKEQQIDTRFMSQISKLNILGSHGIDHYEIYPKTKSSESDDDGLPF